MISSNVPLAVASKTMRHSKLGITVDTYGHLTPQTAQDAVDTISTALDTVNQAANGDAR